MLKGETNDKKKRIKVIPVIQQLKNVLLSECDYEMKLGTDQYIIAPSLSRSTVTSDLSKGFTHFKRVAGIDENKCFKELRNTFKNIAHSEFGDIELTATVSDHSSIQVLKKHYLSQFEAAKKIKGLRIF